MNHLAVEDLKQHWVNALSSLEIQAVIELYIDLFPSFKVHYSQTGRRAKCRVHTQYGRKPLTPQ